MSDELTAARTRVDEARTRLDAASADLRSHVEEMRQALVEVLERNGEHIAHPDPRRLAELQNTYAEAFGELERALEALTALTGH